MIAIQKEDLLSAEVKNQATISKTAQLKVGIGAQTSTFVLQERLPTLMEMHAQHLV